MCAFHTATEVVCCGHAAQTALASIHWPEGLERPGMEDGFAALSVRMGIHCGEDMTPQQNALTGRYDFFGPAVNLTARVEPYGPPQAVTVTAAVMHEVGGGASALLAEKFIVLAYAKARSGKGLKEPLVLTALLPRELAGLENAVRKVVDANPGAGAPNPMSASMKSGSLPLSPEAGPPGRVSAAARSEMACMGVVAFDPTAGAWERDVDKGVTRAGQRLEQLRTAVADTHGHVSCVVNGAAWVSWGLHGKRTQQCANESARCVMLLAQKHAPAGHTPTSLLESGNGLNASLPLDHNSFYAGLVTGPLVTVELKGGGRRFVTPFGQSVAVAETLCRQARALRKRVLVADLSEDDAMDGHAGQVGYVVPVEPLAVERAGAVEMVDVYELDLGTLSKAAEESRAVPLSQTPRHQTYRRVRGRGATVFPSQVDSNLSLSLESLNYTLTLGQLREKPTPDVATPPIPCAKIHTPEVAIESVTSVGITLPSSSPATADLTLQ